MDITLPGYQVTGISFTRTIHRPIEGIDVLLGQMREDEEMFDFFAHLPSFPSSLHCGVPTDGKQKNHTPPV